MQVLVVENDRMLASALQKGLESEGYSVRVCSTGEEGFYLLQAEAFDLVLLDIVLPGHDGFEILETLRRRSIRTPVLITTSRGTVEDRIRGLDAGADDYLVTPFAIPELLARMRAVLRRVAPNVEMQLRLTNLEVDTKRRTVQREGKPIRLTRREFELLEYFLSNKDRLVSRSMLARDVWNATSGQVRLDNVIDVQMARLRRKIDEGFEPKLIHTVRGLGFVMRDKAD